jgi:hypothetical protein
MAIKKQGGALILKRALKRWGWPKFAENLCASPFNKIYQMRPLLAGSVLLDNNFKIYYFWNLIALKVKIFWTWLKFSFIPEKCFRKLCKKLDFSPKYYFVVILFKVSAWLSNHACKVGLTTLQPLTIQSQAKLICPTVYHIQKAFTFRVICL